MLSTPRLRLRPHGPEDVTFMIELNSDPEVVRYTCDGPVDAEQAAMIVASLDRQYREEKIGRFIVLEMEGGRKIGWCGLKRMESGEIDLGYRFLRSRWGRGYATEAAAACLEYGFKTLGFRRIEARVAPENAASLNVVRKLGMRPCGTARENGKDWLLFEVRAPT